MELWGETITFAAAFFLFLALALALSFECVNGFHDTANAVATVIYTHTLKPTYAVVYSGLLNLIGVLTSSGLVAYGIIALLPSDLVTNIGTGDVTGQYVGFAMIFALLISAILWNIGTWFFGLPVSSTHTLIGAILGVGVANAVMNGHNWTEGLNFEQINKVVLALLLSPIAGFVASAVLLLLLKFLVNRPELFKSPEKDETPPSWIRSILIFTCGGVSFAHGYNDGQKGMGLIMLILIGILPGVFSLKSPDSPAAFGKTSDLATKSAAIFQSLSPTAAPAMAPTPAASGPDQPVTTAQSAPEAKLLTPKLDNDTQAAVHSFVKSGKPVAGTFPAFAQECDAVKGELANLQSFEALPLDQRKGVRKDIYLLTDGLGKLVKSKAISDKDQLATIKSFQKNLQGYTQYIPVWVKVAVALALGLGTMVGWKRVVVTVGEKIGKAHMTYAQGMSAELVAGVTVLGAGLQGWPVSTTHVLSSGIAGTMAANRSGLQTQTLINILMAWVLTLPVCVFLGASLFSAALFVIFHFFGVH